jgi:hypothetical protein
MRSWLEVANTQFNEARTKWLPAKDATENALAPPGQEEAFEGWKVRQQVNADRFATDVRARGADVKNAVSQLCGVVQEELKARLDAHICSSS